MATIDEEINQSKFESDFQRAHLNLIFTANWFRDQSKAMFKQFDLTSQQFNVLRILKGAHPKVCSAGYIKDVMIDKSPDLTRLIDRLISKGLVSRCVCPDNRRKLDITITDKGISLLNKINPIVKKESEKLDNITKQEAVELSRILDKMRGKG